MVRMARFLLTAMPFTGHVAPIAAVAAELVARGHDVRFYTGPRFRERVEATGARLVPWRKAPDFDENDLAATFPRLVGAKGMRQVFINLEDCFMRTAPAQVEDLTEEWEREPWDALAAEETSIGATLFCRRFGLPAATIAVLPLNLAGTEGPPSGLGLTPGTNPFTRLRDAVLRGLVPLLARPLKKPLEDAQRAVGLTPDGLTMEKLVFSRKLIAASGAPSLDFRRRDRPDFLHFVGRLTPVGGSAQAPPWWGDLDGRTVVHVTQGTQNIDPADLLRPALEALADLDVLVVATTGSRTVDTVLFPVPANARVTGFVSYADLLPRVDVMITNGGWGGTLAALSHGIPLVIAGGDLDKPEVAARVAWAGAGVNLRTGTPTAVQVRAGYERVTTDASYRAAAEGVAAEMRALGGAPRAAELLEEFAS